MPAELPKPPRVLGPDGVVVLPGVDVAPGVVVVLLLPKREPGDVEVEPGVVACCGAQPGVPGEQGGAAMGGR